MWINPNINRELNNAKTHFGPNLEILTSIRGDLSCGQTHELKMELILILKLNMTLNVKVNHRKKQ